MWVWKPSADALLHPVQMRRQDLYMTDHDTSLFCILISESSLCAVEKEENYMLRVLFIIFLFNVLFNHSRDTRRIPFYFPLRLLSLFNVWTLFLGRGAGFDYPNTFRGYSFHPPFGSFSNGFGSGHSRGGGAGRYF